MIHRPINHSGYTRSLAWLIAGLCAGTAFGCSSSEDSDPASNISPATSDAGDDSAEGSTEPSSDGGAPANDNDNDNDTDESDTGGSDTGEDDADGGTGDDDRLKGDAGASQQPERITIPEALSLTGCDAVGPLCTFTQDGDDLSANCGGLTYTGTLDADGDLTLVSEAETTDDGAEVVRKCDGSINRLGRVRATCQVTTEVEGEANTESCQLRTDPQLLPSVECIELPSELQGLTICGGEADAELSLGNCRVVQDGCEFQAECEDGTTFTGSATSTGIRFDQTFPALADAETPAEGGDPAFTIGEAVSHRCSAQLDGDTWVGECAAGRAGRGGTNTSVCAVEASGEAATTCDPISPLGEEQIFVLDGCENLKNGVDGEPGIGEPLCAFRQNNCIWEIQCGRDLVFSGRVEPGETKLEWLLDTGTACEGSFTESGEFTGVCAVPDLFSCSLGTKEAAPGSDSCPSAPIGEPVTSRGCGNGSGDAMACRELLWHGCDFMAICSFSSMQSLVFTGTASEKNNAGYLDLTGIGDWSCHVEEPTPEALEADPHRASNEWLGQCETAEGGQCRENFDPETGSGFRGLQLFWGEAEESVDTEQTEASE